MQKVETIPNGIKVVIDGVNAAGQKTHVESSTKFDGNDYPSKSTLDGKPDTNAADMISAKKVDDYTIELTTKLKGSCSNRKEGLPFIQRTPVETHVVHGNIRDASDLLRLLRSGGHSAVAGRLARAVPQDRSC